MREFRIILATIKRTPSETVREEIKRGALTRAHVWLRQALLANFDGFTSYEATGAWRNDDGAIDREPVIIYDIATGSNELDTRILKELALTACKQATEDCVYFRDGQGNVKLLRPADTAAPAFPRKGGGTYRALDLAVQQRETEIRTQNREDK